MSALSVKKAIETAINGISPAIATVFENTPYTPVVDTPYQQVWFVGFIPSNPEYGASHQLKGYCQIDLMYPLLNGSGIALTRAELIKSVFKYKSTFIADGISVNICETPEISSGRNDGDRWKVCVKIYYSAWVIVN